MKKITKNSGYIALALWCTFVLLIIIIASGWSDSGPVSTGERIKIVVFGIGIIAVQLLIALVIIRKRR